ncbi:MAG: glucuronate isomerase [Bacteroidetes bacterium]|nr:glucuronate isomerase [Bacteroidota bacterium]MBU1117072.1 glucuronate isomerase [Bacteroidota bacterium]MBU1799080.1 glucuronate isomerase [Bacteroidota bacterium]
MSTLKLHEDRFFDSDSAIRNAARELFEAVKNCPIISPHGHVDPSIFVENKPFPNPTELFISPDHYVFRMLYSQGISLEELDIPQRNGKRLGIDSRKVWQIFAENYFLFAGTPSGVWLNYEFIKVFGIEEKLNGNNAQKIYDLINDKLQSEEYLPRNLFKKLNIELLTTTDSATDNLEFHKKIKDSGWDGRVIPCFRPDAVTNLLNPTWKDDIYELGKLTSLEITNYKIFITALEKRREYFKANGATSTDHGVISPLTHKLSERESEEIFSKALSGKVSVKDAELFTANMLMEMARMSCEDGLTMQIHAGSNRNHNNIIFEKYGLDKGCDIPQQTEYTNNLKELLNAYGNNPNFTVIVFTLDETNYSRELAPLAGHYPAMKLGPAWWFHDSIEGMTRYRHSVTETAGFYNTVGFNDDTRAFVSIPARHDVARRVDANFLGGLIAKHIIDLEEGKKIIKDLTYNLVKKAYKL